LATGSIARLAGVRQLLRRVRSRPQPTGRDERYGNGTATRHDVVATSRVITLQRIQGIKITELAAC
jgi:hypothetical protein